MCVAIRGNADGDHVAIEGQAVKTTAYYRASGTSAALVPLLPCQPGRHHWTLQAMATGPGQGAQMTYGCTLCLRTVTRAMQAEETHAMAQVAEARLALQAVLARLNDGAVR